MRSLLIVSMTVGLIYFAAGCGGGTESVAGSARITILWPETTRLIPAASQSINVSMSGPRGTIASRVIPRPAGGGPAQVTFTNLPVGQLAVTATAYPNADGTGIPQARGSTTLQITAGNTTAFTVTMDSTIDRIEITPAALALNVGEVVTLTASAKDAVGNLVLTLPATITWISSADSIARVDSAGNVTGVFEGTAQITARETESNKIASMQVTVAPPAPSLSKSRVSIHLIGRYTNGARKIVAAGPRTLKVLGLENGLGAEMLAALRDYKSRYPAGKTVLRIYTQWRHNAAATPEANAQDFWNRVLAPPLSLLSQSDRLLIDYLEGPNEGESTPTWQTIADARWFGRFWAALAPTIKNNGYLPCAGSIPVGNPPGTPSEIEAKIEAFVPALQACLQAGGAWSYHAYTIQYTTDPGVEYWYSLRYRQFYDFLNRRYPALASLPMILTEGGVDESGNPQTSGWQARGTAAKFQNWLTWYDGELRKDPYILGVTLFQSGDSAGWPSFDVEPIADWLAAYLRL